MPPESWEARGPAEAIVGGLYGLQAPLHLASPQRIELRTVVFGAQLAALEHWGLYWSVRLAPPQRPPASKAGTLLTELRTDIWWSADESNITHNRWLL